MWMYSKTSYKLSKILKSVSSFVIISLLASCDPITLGIIGGAAIGNESLNNQEGFTGAVSDSFLQSNIDAALLDYDIDLFDRIELSVKHGTVVVIGYMHDEEQCRRVMQFVRETCGNRAVVYDETSVGEFPDGNQVAVDASTTSRIKSAMTFNSNIMSRNYDVTTVKSIVYISGTAQTKYERDVVLNCARTTSNVERVVSYIRINKNVKTDEYKSTKTKGVRSRAG